MVAERKRAAAGAGPRERHIMFKGLNVRSILSGEKTQTRRVMAPQPPSWKEVFAFEGGTFALVGEDTESEEFGCPFGRPGERLWVREAAYIAPSGMWPARECNVRDPQGRPRLVLYAADCRDGRSALAEDEYRLRKTPALLFPRWACRVVLELVRVRAERLQAITEADIQAEGITPAVAAQLAGVDVSEFGDLREAFRVGWDAIHRHHPGARWGQNPWVWLLEFRRMQ